MHPEQLLSNLKPGEIQTLICCGLCLIPLLGGGFLGWIALTNINRKLEAGGDTLPPSSSTDNEVQPTNPGGPRKVTLSVEDYDKQNGVGQKKESRPGAMMSNGKNQSR